MAARRCTSCLRAYPLDTFACPDCGAQCFFDQLGDPDAIQAPAPLIGSEDKVELWRFEQLLAAGYQLHAAEELAARTAVDLHQAVDLIEQRGCDPNLAARILL